MLSKRRNHTVGWKTTCDNCGRSVLGVFSSLRNINGRDLCPTCAKNPFPASYYCNSCGSYSLTPLMKGSLWVELVLYLFWIAPGIIYSVWRRTAKPNVCPLCKAAGLVPAAGAKTRGSPIAYEELQSNNVSQERHTKKCPVCAEVIKLEAIKCRFCGEKFDPDDVAQQVAERRKEYSSENRVLCSDGNCIGVIGLDGRCKVCGKAGPPAVEVSRNG